MTDARKMNRRQMIAKSAGAAGAAAALPPTAAEARPAKPLPAGFDAQEPLKRSWPHALSDVVQVDFNRDAPELGDESVKERHRIYCYLLMKLLIRFWNGNKRGPFGTYPYRAQQIEAAGRYHGERVANPDPSKTRVAWDRYLGHNIACIAVDGNGAILDFDFNHNDLFRSSAEHAESRLVRRLFSLTKDFDDWKSGRHPALKPQPISLADVTLYTTLESCAQCSGVMSLGGVKQVIYMQNDFTAYMIGNIMYNLANRIPLGGPDKSAPGAPVPIPAAKVDLEEFDRLNAENLRFGKTVSDAQHKNDATQAFFVSADQSVIDFDPSITSFLCTDVARDIFAGGAAKFDAMALHHPDARFPGGSNDVLTNAQCLAEAQEFFNYADIAGYRGSPHKL